MKYNTTTTQRLIAYLLILSLCLQSCLNSDVPIDTRQGIPNEPSQIVTTIPNFQQEKSPINSSPARQKKIVIQPSEHLIHIPLLLNVNESTKLFPTINKLPAFTPTKQNTTRYPVDKQKSLKDSRAIASRQKQVISQILKQPFKTKTNHTVQFLQENGYLVAKVQENWPSNRPIKQLPVHIERTFSLANLAHLTQAGHSPYVHIHKNPHTQTNQVCVYRMGLPGGMKSGKEEEDDEPEIKEEENSNANEELEVLELPPLQKKRRIHIGETNALALGNLHILPREILREILFYAGLQAIGQVRLLNRFFYQLITGYQQVGLQGMEHTPGPNLFTGFSKPNKVLNFSIQRPMHNLMPSFFFYQLVRKAKQLHPAFWPNLKDTNIEVLDLRGMCLNDENINRLVQHLPNMKIKKLILQKTSISNQGIAKLAQVLPKTSIQKLDLAESRISDQDIAALAPYLTNIQYLDLSGIQISDQGVAALAPYSTNIQHLHLKSTKISVQSIAALTPYLTNIQHLSLRNSEINDQIIAALAPYLTNIQHLDLSENEISDQGVVALAPHLTNIQHLDLSENQIGDQGVTALAPCLNNIQYLNLAINKIGSLGMSELAIHLPKSKLQHLDLGSNKIGSLGAAKLAIHLPKSKLQYLDLGGNQLGTLGAAELAPGLLGSEIQTLILNNNGISDQGLETLAFYLPKANIQHLELLNNELSDEGILRLAPQLLNTNTSKVIIVELPEEAHIYQILAQQHPNIEWSWKHG